MGMALARHPLVASRQEQDHCRRCEAAELEKAQHWIAALHCKQADEEATGEPHRPRPATNTRRECSRARWITWGR
jgi:hypothetical protein